MDGPSLKTRLARDNATSLWNQKVTLYRTFLARHLVQLVYLVYLVLWLNETNRMNQISQINKTNQTNHIEQINQVVERARGRNR